jgi:hypothetical protein
MVIIGRSLVRPAGVAAVTAPPAGSAYRVDSHRQPNTHDQADELAGDKGRDRAGRFPRGVGERPTDRHRRRGGTHTRSSDAVERARIRHLIRRSSNLTIV